MLSVPDGAENRIRWRPVPLPVAGGSEMDVREEVSPVGQERVEELEAMLERLRGELYKLVDGNPAHLSDARVLPLSCQMDALIVRIQRAKYSQSNQGNSGDTMKT
jgi:hypothetical protein